VLSVKRVEFVSDRIPYIVLRGLWLNIIVSLNAYAPPEEKRDFSRDSFYEELQQVFDHFPQYQIKILLDFVAKLRREGIFKPATQNESLHEDSNDDVIRAGNFATSKL
jgi:hypothetical protein